MVWVFLSVHYNSRVRIPMSRKKELVRRNNSTGIYDRGEAIKPSGGHTTWK